MKKGFSLIELLVVIAIIGSLATIMVMMLTGPQKSARDGKRKSDMETIRSGLELYKSDCGQYPASLPAVGSALTGTNGAAGAACSTSNKYIQAMPADPTAGRNYGYSRQTTQTYTLCSALERNSTTVNCGGASCGASCTYAINNP
jgi:type II secretion system protein G